MTTPYSRENPSPRYRRLVAYYSDMHTNGYTGRAGDTEFAVSPEEAFPGHELPKFAQPIKELIDQYSAKTLLDYGSGKGYQYSAWPFTDPQGQKFASITDYFGIEEVTCFDPAVEEFRDLPQQQFDGVVSTDVLEHCPAEDVPWIVREMFSHARHFVFVNIACYKAFAQLPDGTNAHVTVRNEAWWGGVFAAISADFPDVFYKLGLIRLVSDETGAPRNQLVWAVRDT